MKHNSCYHRHCLWFIAYIVLLPAESTAQASLAPNQDSIAAIVSNLLPGLGNSSPGCVVGMADRTKTLYLRGFGMADLEHNVPITPASSFHVASLSKQFTAFGIAILVSEGRVKPTDRIGQFITGLRPKLAALRVEQLLSHTSGLRDQWTLLALAGWREDDPKSQADILWLVRRQNDLNFAQGTEWLYSNTGYTLLAEIVEQVSGTSFLDFMRNRVFEPLGMTSSRFPAVHQAVISGRAHGYEPTSDHGWVTSNPKFDNYGASGLQTSVIDLLKWTQNLLNARVEPGAVRLMRSTLGYKVRGTTTYGLGLVHWTQGGLRGFGHGGNDAGFQADLLVFEDSGLSTITLCNASTARPYDINPAVAEYVLRDSWHEPAPAADATTPPAAASAKQPGPASHIGARALVGKYYSDELDAEWSLEIKSDSLVVRRPRGLVQVFVKDSAGLYRFGAYRIDLEVAGRDVRAFTLSSGRVRNLRFVRLSN
jgi:CubicO group peptidase (beta-lactamase class C family)